jgi:hypothetical protein
MSAAKEKTMCLMMKPRTVNGGYTSNASTGLSALPTVDLSQAPNVPISY